MIRAAIFNDTRAARHYGCDLVMAELHRRLQEVGVEATWHSPVAVDWRDQPLPCRGEIDIVVVNGEGSIHHSRDRPRARYLSEIGTFAAERLGAPAYLINATVAEIDAETADHLRAFARISVRESASRDTLAAFGIDSEIIPDLTVMARLPIPDARSGVMGTDSVLVDEARAIRSACQERGWPFRSMAWKGKKDVPQDPDDAERLSGAQAFAGLLASHQLVVTGRFHTATFCLATRTPFVALESNTPKISAMLKDCFGDDRRMIAPAAVADLDPAPFNHWSAAELSALEAYIAKGEAAAQALFRAMAEGL